MPYGALSAQVRPNFPQNIRLSMGGISSDWAQPGMETSLGSQATHEFSGAGSVLQVRGEEILVKIGLVKKKKRQ